MRFVHLRLHTEYSLNDSTLRLKPLMLSCKNSQMPAIAMTDRMNLYALVKFYKTAMAEGLKPILGADIHVQENEQATFNHLILLCQNNQGYRNLTKLISKAYLEGQAHQTPLVKKAWVAEYSEGLIALSGGREGDIGQSLLAGNRDNAQAYLHTWRKIFPQRFYLELQRTQREGEENYLHQVIDLATQTQTPVVATNDVRFLQSSDFEAHEARVCISGGYVLDDPNRPKLYSDQQYLKTPAEMCALFDDIPEAIENTLEIAKRCNVSLTLGKNYLPEFPIPAGLTETEFFCQESRKGLEKRLDVLLERKHADFIEKRQAYDERLKIELGVINEMGFPGYFLIVADFIQWAKDNDIPVGPGRGSGAGSLVAYALKITDIDPLEYDLLFERFLNPERVSMPDFDIDFCMDNRDRVIDYVSRHYGKEKVSQIITYGSMAAKAVIRDVGRVYGHPYGFVDRIAKQIPFEVGMTLTKALEASEELKTAYDEDEEVRAVLDMGLSLEGLSKNVGKHAGGVLISPSNLTDFTPLYCEADGTGVMSQYDKNDVEAVGLVKFDFLGLRNLTIIDWALKALNKKRKKENKAPIYIDAISLKDSASFDLLKAQKTTAVFQLESRGMKELIKRLQPDVFEDIIALVALYRPGPLGSGMVDDFVNRKNGVAEVEYPHPALESVLEPTYGIILYQEQVMQIAQVLGNFSLGGADLLRRAMGKKKPEEMEKQRSIFMQGALENEVDAELATYIFDLMEKFSGYGFNKTVDKDTKVYTINGIKKIEACSVGDTVISCTVTGEYVQSKVLALHDHGKVPLWEIEFDDSSKEKCTLDHKWLTEKGQQPLWKIIQLGCQVWGCAAYQTRYTCSPKTMSDLHEYDQDRSLGRQRTQNVLWNSDQNPQKSPRTFSTMCRMSKNSTRNQSENVQGIRTYPSNASKIFGDSQENLSTTRYTATASATFKTVARYSSQRISKNSSQSPCFTQIIQTGNVVRTSSKKAGLYSQHTDTLSNRTKTNRFCQSSKKDGNRSGWPLAFSSDSFGGKFTAGTETRSDVKSGDYETILAINPTFDAGFQRQLWRTYITQSEPTITDNRRWQLGRNTVLRKPVRATFMGWHQGYDLEVDHPEHNFLLASGLCCSNSHSAAYALVSYQTAWLKAHYPAEFMAAVLSADMDNTEKVVMLIDDCRQLELTIIAPDINQSNYRFSVNDAGEIVYGMGAIKGAGEAILNLITEERQAQGNYRSLADLCQRISAKKINRRILETLIKAGAFDNTGANRNSLMAFLPEALRMSNQHHRDRGFGQSDLFGGAMTIEKDQQVCPVLAEWPERQRLDYEKKSLGLYLTGHPINAYKTELSKMISHRLVELAEIDEEQRYTQQPVLIAGLVADFRFQNTDKGKRAFITLDDQSAYYEMLIFSDVLEQFEALICKDELLIIEGKLNSDWSGKTRLRVEHLHDMHSARNTFARHLVLSIDRTEYEKNSPHLETVEEDLMQTLSEFFEPNATTSSANSCPIIIKYTTATEQVHLQLGSQYHAPLQCDVIQKLQQSFGQNSVTIEY